MSSETSDFNDWTNTNKQWKECKSMYYYLKFALQVFEKTRENVGRTPLQLVLSYLVCAFFNSKGKFNDSFRLTVVTPFGLPS